METLEALLTHPITAAWGPRLVVEAVLAASGASGSGERLSTGLARESPSAGRGADGGRGECGGLPWVLRRGNAPEKAPTAATGDRRSRGWTTAPNTELNVTLEELLAHPDAVDRGLVLLVFLVARLTGQPAPCCGAPAEKTNAQRPPRRRARKERKRRRGR